MRRDFDDEEIFLLLGCWLVIAFVGYSMFTMLFNNNSRSHNSSYGSSSSSYHGSSSSSSHGSSHSSSSSSSHSSSSSSYYGSSYSNSYDAGYNAIYDDDDYDWDRYYSDDDYALGVDDAMDELDW